MKAEPPFAVCSDCDGPLTLKIWGEGVDASIYCNNCGNKEIYR